MTPLFKIREALVSDEAFIYLSWLKSFNFSNIYFKAINEFLFNTVYHRVIEKILKDPETEIKIACLPDDEDVILGFSVYNPTKKILHYVFTKEAWRKCGIAKALTDGPIETITHLTPAGLGFLKNTRKELIQTNKDGEKYIKKILNPFIL